MCTLWFSVLVLGQPANRWAVQALNYMLPSISRTSAMHQASAAVEGKHGRTLKDDNLRVCSGIAWAHAPFTSTQKGFLAHDTMKTQKESCEN